MRYILILTVALMWAPFASAADMMQTLNFDQSMRIDPLGDCTMSIDFTLTAQQFAAWNQKYGRDKALLKLDMGKIVSQYDTYDWDVKVQEMERRVTVSFKAHGVVKHDGDGHYEFPVPKSWKGGGKNGNTLEYNYIEPIGSGVVGQYQTKLILPASTSDIKDDVGESGEPIVRYVVPVNSSSRALLLTVGIIAMVIGLAMTGLGFAGSRDRRQNA
jgi:hypothetical protein